MGARRPSLAGVSSGPEGLGAPRALEVARGLWAIVADAPADAWSASEVERRLRDLDWVARQAEAHEAVIEHWLGKQGLVPMRLLTLYSSDEKALQGLRARLADLRSVAALTRNRCEWAFKVTLDPARARARARSTEPEAAPSGHAFLQRKRRERDAPSEAAAAARVEVKSAIDALRARSGHALVPELGPKDGLLLANATFLVLRTQEKRFLAAADEMCGRLTALGCEARVSGPWPPYVTAASLGEDQGGRGL